LALLQPQERVLKPQTTAESRGPLSREPGPQGPPLRPSDIADVPGLPPFEPDMLEYNPGELEDLWYWVRSLFRRRPHDRAA
jgi:hypothetical protein